ncbi:anti-sigma factor family protein [Streptomyces sp. NPDC059373]
MTVYGSGPGAPHDPRDPHVDVGAYVLGVLDDIEMARFEHHLAVCPECGEQLDELSGLVPLLAELGPAGAGSPVPPSGDAMLRKLVDRVSTERGVQRRRRWLSLVAAAVLVVGGPTAAYLAASSGNSGSAAPKVTASETHTTKDPSTGVKATVGLTPKKWGTQVDLTLAGVSGPLTCRLVAIGKDGSQQTVSTWSVPATGYGTTTQPTPLTIEGGAGLSPSDITRLDVVTTKGERLVSVNT